MYRCLATGNDGNSLSNPAIVMVTSDVISCDGKQSDKLLCSEIFPLQISAVELEYNRLLMRWKVLSEIPLVKWLANSTIHQVNYCHC